MLAVLVVVALGFGVSHFIKKGEPLNAFIVTLMQVVVCLLHYSLTKTP
jgi:hypothetical protein